MRPWFQDASKQILADYERAQGEYVTPFDQLYQKEVKLVNDIVKAEQALQQMRDDLPDPSGQYDFDPAMMEEDAKYGNLYSELEPQYLRDMREQERARGRHSASSLFEDVEELRHSYNQREAQTVEDLIASGQVRRQDFEFARAMKKQNREINVGYALITFSHADEAKKTLMLTSGEAVIDSSLVSILPKGKLDHSDLDKSYFIRKL